MFNYRFCVLISFILVLIISIMYLWARAENTTKLKKQQKVILKNVQKEIKKALLWDKRTEEEKRIDKISFGGLSGKIVLFVNILILMFSSFLIYVSIINYELSIIDYAKTLLFLVLFHFLIRFIFRLLIIEDSKNKEFHKTKENIDHYGERFVLILNAILFILEILIVFSNFNDFYSIAVGTVLVEMWKMTIDTFEKQKNKLLKEEVKL